MISPNPKIVIMGGGFAGMAALLSLTRYSKKARVPWDIILIDPGTGHALFPEIPQVLERGLDIHSRILDFSTLLKGTDVHFRQGRVTQVDRRHRQVFFAEGGPLHYDCALLAVGTQAAFPNVPGLHTHAWPVRTAGDAAHISKWLGHKPLRRIVIAGGGFTGVELAASLSDRYQVAVLERRDALLPNMARGHGRYALAYLKASGVGVWLSENIVRVGRRTVYTEEHQLSYDLLIWAGGIKPPNWILESGIPCGPDGYPIVNAWGQVDDRLFVAGDLWKLKGHSSGQTAQVAEAMGTFIGKVMAARVLGSGMPRPFHHGAHGMVVSLNRRRGVGWVLMPSVSLHGVVAGKLKRIALTRYRWTVVRHRRSAKNRRVS